MLQSMGSAPHRSGSLECWSTHFPCKFCSDERGLGVWTSIALPVPSLMSLNVLCDKTVAELFLWPSFCYIFYRLSTNIFWINSRHERMHTKRPYHVEDAEKYCLEDDLVNMEVLDEVLNI